MADFNSIIGTMRYERAVSTENIHELDSIFKKELEGKEKYFDEFNKIVKNHGSSVLRDGILLKLDSKINFYALLKFSISKDNESKEIMDSTYHYELDFVKLFIPAVIASHSLMRDRDDVNFNCWDRNNGFFKGSDYKLSLNYDNGSIVFYYGHQNYYTGSEHPVTGNDYGNKTLFKPNRFQDEDLDWRTLSYVWPHLFNGFLSVNELIDKMLAIRNIPLSELSLLADFNFTVNSKYKEVCKKNYYKEFIKEIINNRIFYKDIVLIVPKECFDLERYELNEINFDKWMEHERFEF